jgi:hypothetical protein
LESKQSIVVTLLSLSLSLVPSLVSASHEVLYPENFSDYNFGQVKAISVKTKCLVDESESQYTKFFDPIGNPLGTKIDTPFKSKYYNVFGPKLDLKLEYNRGRIIKSVERGFNSDGEEIISQYEVIKVDEELRPIKSKSYSYYKKVKSSEVYIKTESELESSNKAEDEILSYEMKDSIIIQKRDEDLNSVKNNEKHYIHEYKYLDNLYVQKDSAMEDGKVVSTVEAAIEINSNNQIVSVMNMEGGSNKVIIQKENFYDENDRIILEKRLDGISYTFEYYENGLIKKSTKIDSLGIVLFSANYNYLKIDVCGNPIAEEASYENSKFNGNHMRNYCPKVLRQYTYVYYQSCNEL